MVCKVNSLRKRVQGKKLRVWITSNEPKQIVQSPKDLLGSVNRLKWSSSREFTKFNFMNSRCGLNCWISAALVHDHREPDRSLQAVLKKLNGFRHGKLGTSAQMHLQSEREWLAKTDRLLNVTSTVTLLRFHFYGFTFTISPLRSLSYSLLLFHRLWQNYLPIREQ